MKPINIEEVYAVYSGKAGYCCCGCAGKYSHATAHRKWAQKNRGYAIEDKEVSDRSVKLIINKIDKAIAAGVTPIDSGGYISVDVGNRTYIAYFKTSK